tara:strand:- start:9628 stop:10839 length:1212 start_codon:yes stop_codon:yes gene_type:complete
LNQSSFFEKNNSMNAMTVSQITARVRNLVEPEFLNIWVQGEVSNFKPASSGHVYFSLKDQHAHLSAAIFGWGRKQNRAPIRDGMEVLCHGKISIYPPRGSYQMIVDRIEPLGVGALQLAVEELKKKLKEKGWFEESRKKELPLYPKRIAVVTSATSAALQDILQVLGRRGPQIEVTVIPAVVQGEGAPESVSRGIQVASKNDLGEVILVCRGGGSLEDLMAFNDERVAKAIYDSPLPVISGVGHEIDFSIADFVADLRAPTPSAAAELVSAGWVDVRERIFQWDQRLQYSMDQCLIHQKRILLDLENRLVSPKDQIQEQIQRVDEWSERLKLSMTSTLKKFEFSFGKEAARLEALSPLKVLSRGYTITMSTSPERVVVSSKEISQGDKLKLKFRDGESWVQAL